MTCVVYKTDLMKQPYCQGQWTLQNKKRLNMHFEKVLTAVMFLLIIERPRRCFFALNADIRPMPSKEDVNYFVRSS